MAIELENGVVLPDAPVSDQYPYALIMHTVWDDTEFYSLFVIPIEAWFVLGPVVDMDFDVFLCFGTGYVEYSAMDGSTSWTETANAGDNMMVPNSDPYSFAWANHDIPVITGMDETGNPVAGGIFDPNVDYSTGTDPVQPTYPERYSIARVYLVGYADQARRLSGKTEEMSPEKVLEELKKAPKGTTTSWIDEIVYSYVYNSEDELCQKMTSQTEAIHLPSEFTFAPTTTIFPVIEAEFPLAKTMDCSFFENNTGLITAKLPQIIELGSSAFYGCTALTTVDIPCVEAVPNRAFYGCTALKTVNMPAAKTIDAYGFSGCTALVDFDFTNIESIGENGFYAIPFTEVVLPATISVGAKAFGMNDSLKSVNLPVAKTIGASAFANCDSIKKIDLGAAEEVGIAAFWSAQMALETVIIRTNKVCQLAEIREGKENIDVHFGNSSHHYYIYVPAALIDAYKADATWASYPAIRFRTIEDYPDICGTTA